MLFSRAVEHTYILSFLFPSIVNAGGKEPPYATRSFSFLTLETHNFSTFVQYLNIIYKLKALKLKRVGINTYIIMYPDLTCVLAFKRLDCCFIPMV